MLLLIISLVFYFICPDSIEDGWKGIKSLKTDKATAEKILGKPSYVGNPETRGTSHHEYETEEATVQINYSTEPCKKNFGGRGDYDVPKDTILTYSVFPKNNIKLSDFKYNRQKYLQFERGQEYFDFEYENDDDGITFSTKIRDGIEYIYHIRFDPKIKNINYRECTSKINFEIENGWEGIKTLQTNKTEVEKLLGTPTDSSDYATEYKTEEAWISVKYSSEPCRKNENGRGDYNVPKDTVLKYDVSLNKALKLADFKYNRDKFKQEAGGGYFENSDAGIYFITRKRDNSEYISSITFEPGIRNTGNRKCKMMKK